MTDPARLGVYLASLEDELPPELAALEETALAEGVPLIRPDTRRTLRLLLHLHVPSAVLEIGAAVGFSALFMAGACGAPITTIEHDAERAEKARANFARLSSPGRITLLEGGAEEILPTLAGPYDFIFLDAAKGQYPSLLPEILRLLPAGGVLVADNCLQEGTLLDSTYLVERRDRTIHHRLRTFIRTLVQNEDLVTDLLPVGDGLAVSVKKRTNA